MFQEMISIFTDLKVPYMISDKSLLLMWLKCNTGNQTVSFQIYLPWWRKNSDIVEQEMKKRGLTKQKSYGKMYQALGYKEVWGYRGRRVDLFSNVYKGDYSLVGLRSNHNLHYCYMKVTSIARYQWMDGVLVRAPYPLEEALQSAYGPYYRDYVQWKIGTDILSGYDPLVWFCLSTNTNKH